MEFWHDSRGGWGASWARHRMRGGARRLRRGILKLLLLKLLAELPRHGYDLIRAVRERGWGRGGAGSVYPLLAGLEAAGLIAGRDEGDRRTYEITEKGRRLLEEHAGDLGSLFTGDDADEEHPLDDPRVDLREALARLVQAVSQVGPSSATETLAKIADLLDRTRKEIYTVLAQE